MLKTRIIGVIIIRDGIAVQSIGFKQYLPIGIPEISIEYLNRWGIDEIVLLDIDATKKHRRPDYRKVQQYSRHCQVPLAVGGGITRIEDIEQIIHSGADKVVINAEAVKNPDIIQKGARLFGSQCMVVSIDARRDECGNYEVFTHSGTRPTGISPVEMARIAERKDAGEILLTSIDQDGSKQGYDLDLIRSVAEEVSIPVIACGGAGHPEHMKAVIEIPVSAVAAANFFHYHEHSVITNKRYLKDRSSHVRLDSYVTYQDFRFGSDGRPLKIDDNVLEKLRFVYIPEEQI
jgi:cyclase